jgi:SAM-dependent methyltransferase
LRGNAPVTRDAAFASQIYASAKRFSRVLRSAGIGQTLSACVSVVEDRYLHSFDRIYRVKTSGIITLENMSLAPSQVVNAVAYVPVNAWALRTLLRRLGLPKEYRFADLGCGLGRPLLLAAEYGFAKATGVDFAPELCAKARENVARSRLSAQHKAVIEIVQADVLDYCEQTDDDVFFMFRPFHWEFFRMVVSRLTERAAQQAKRLTIIYSERINLPESFAKAFSDQTVFRNLGEYRNLGQQFFIYECGLPDSRQAPAHSKLGKSREES